MQAYRLRAGELSGPRPLDSAVTLAAVLELDCEHDEATVLNVAVQVVVAHSVDPESGLIRRQRLAHIGRGAEGFHLVELLDDPASRGLVELPQCLSGVLVVLNPPRLGRVS